MEKLKKILFFGGNIEGYFSLRTLLSLGESLCGIVVPPKQNHWNSLMSDLAEEYNIPFYRFDINTVEKKMIESFKSDLILISSYPHIFPQEIINIPHLGCVNIHAAILPEYQGKHSLVWAVIEGETEFGVTLHYIDKGIDTGDIIGIKKIKMSNSNINEIHISLIPLVCSLIEENLEGIKNKTIKRTTQSKGTHWKPRVPEDSKIDWSLSSDKINDFIRALAPPWPSAFTYYKGNKIEIISAYSSPINSIGGYGVVQEKERGLVISTSEGVIIANRFRFNGRIVNSSELDIEVGDKFD